MSRLLAAVVLSAAALFTMPSPAAAAVSAPSAAAAAPAVSAPAAGAAAPACGAANIARDRPATASSSENGSLLPAKAFDGNTATRWSSAFSDPQWIQVDLGTAQPLCRVVLRWEAAFAKTFTLQGSATGASWFDLVPAATGTGGTQTIEITAATPARHVRLTGLTRATRYGYSLFELEVYAATVTPPAPAAWPSWGGGPGHAGFNGREGILNATNVDTLHRLLVTGDLDAPVVANGIAYGRTPTLQFAAVDLASGAVRWTTAPATEPMLRYTSDGTVGGGLVYAGDQIGVIHALDAFTGAERWRVRIDGNQVFNAPILAGDTVYAKGDAQGDNTLVYALNAATGAIRWTRLLTGYTSATLAFDGNRIFVAGGNSGLLSGLDASTGAVLWSVPAAQSWLNPVAGWGRVYLSGGAAYDGATGRTLWTRPGAFGFPAVLDGTLYSVELSTPPVLHAIDPATGADRWALAAQPGDPALVSPLKTTFPVVAGGVLYMNLGRVLAIDTVSHRLLWTGPEGSTAAPVVADGRLVTRTAEGLGVYGR